jgi:hypothetical protein
VHAEQDAQTLVDGVLTSVDPGAVRLAPTVRRVGSAGSMSAVTPAVIELRSPSDPLLSRELPFPCVWVAPFHRDAIESLSDSLVVAMLTDCDPRASLVTPRRPRPAGVTLAPSPYLLTMASSYG